MSETSIDPTADPTIAAAPVETDDLLTTPQQAWLELHAQLSDYTTRQGVSS